MEKLLYGIGFSVIVIVILVVVGAITALPVMLLWNWLVPSIFNLRKIGFLESWGLLVLTGILFRSTSSPSNNK